MTALRSIHIIDGKATFSAELMVQLVRAHHHSITGDVSGDRAVVRGVRADNGDEMTATWTLEMAQRAGLMGKDNWKKYPEAMLWARAVSQLCRMLFADCFAGATYTPEEGEFTADELMDEPAPEPVSQTDSGDPADMIVHFGAREGTRLGDLSYQDLVWLATKWAPTEDQVDQDLKDAALAVAHARSLEAA